MIKSWLVIGGVAFIVALGANIITPGDRQWFKRLQRREYIKFYLYYHFIRFGYRYETIIDLAN